MIYLDGITMILLMFIHMREPIKEIDYDELTLNDINVVVMVPSLVWQEYMKYITFMFYGLLLSFVLSCELLVVVG